jgi:hypothetical protein
VRGRFKIGWVFLLVGDGGASWRRWGSELSLLLSGRGGGEDGFSRLVQGGARATLGAPVDCGPVGSIRGFVVFEWRKVRDVLGPAFGLVRREG